MILCDVDFVFIFTTYFLIVDQIVKIIVYDDILLFRPSFCCLFWCSKCY